MAKEVVFYTVQRKFNAVRLQLIEKLLQKTACGHARCADEFHFPFQRLHFLERFIKTMLKLAHKAYAVFNLQKFAVAFIAWQFTAGYHIHFVGSVYEAFFAARLNGRIKAFRIINYIRCFLFCQQSQRI